ncbi:ABC transporter, ATP-binding protein, partial [Teladorsagia circumcincta]
FDGSVTMTNSIVADCLLVTFIITDLPITVLLFGFYSPNWYFHVDLIAKQFSSFTYSSSPLDFILVAALRAFSLIALRIYLQCADNVWDLRMHFLGIAMAIYSHSLVKLLCFAEWPQMLYYPGVWANLSWSILAAALFFVICWCLNTPGLFDYSRLEGSEESSTRVFIPAYIGRVLANIALGGGMAALIQSISIMSLLALGSIVFGGLRGGTFTYATALVSRQIKLDLFRSLVRQEIAFFDTTKSGEIVSRISSDCQVMATNVSTNVNVFMRNTIMLVGSLCVMFYTSWKLTTVTFIAVPVTGFITKWYGSYYDRLSEQTQTTIAAANSKAEEVLATMRTVRSFACENYEADSFEDRLDTTLNVNRKNGPRSLLPVSWIASVRRERQVFEYMHRKPAMALDGTEKPALRGTVRFDDVCFTYPSRPNNPVLKVVLVAQEPVLYNGSIRDNILYGCDWATEEDMLEAAEMANVHGFVMELEKKYDTVCGDRGVQMSGGQKQRIAIARALVRKPCVLVLDEATSALDAESEAQVQEAINRCSGKLTVLIVAHRLSTVEKADIIAVIQEGSVVQIGTHQTLMEDPEGLYYALVSRQLLTEMS